MAGAIVQSKAFKMPGTTSAPQNIALDSPTTAGNCLILAVSAYEASASPGWPAPYDPYNTWYIGADQWSWTTYSGVVQVQYAPNIAARSSYVLGLELPGTYWWHAFLMEVSGIDTSSPIEVNAIRQIQAGTSIGSGSVTPSVASFLVGVMTEDAGTSVSAVSAGWTEQYDDGGAQPLHVATRSGAASTAAECFFTVASTTGAGVILGLEESSGGGGVSEYGAAAIAGSGAFAVTARRARTAAATIAAISSLAVVARRTRRAIAAIAATSTVSVVARSARRGAVTITGTSGLQVGAVEIAGPQEYGAVAIAGSSSVSASATSKRRTSVLIGGSSQVSASGLSFGPRRGAVRIDAFGRLVVSATRGRPGRGTTSIVVESGSATSRELQAQGTTTVGGIE